MRARWVPLTTTLLLLAPACGGGGGDSTAVPTTAAPTSTAAPATSSTTTTAPAATTTTTSAADEEAAVIAAYLAYWDTFFTVTNPGQPDSPLIDQVATGAAAQRLRDVAAEREATNTATRLPEPSVASHSVSVMSIEGNAAEVRDCLVDDSYKLNLSTGEITDDAVATSLLAVSMVRTAEGWKLAVPAVRLQRWDGVTTCEQ